ncbi:MlaD family protein [Patulibacter minatonensis]|uniref:MlaD family protein n=1 Tax=Patulibacter minatonensis TaxID=298163 RepID=UPI00047E7208|nr:MlaD family protein [Patulibacter minatonensis]
MTDRSSSAGRDRIILELKRAAGPTLLFVLLIFAGIFAAVQVVTNLAGDKPWVSYKPYKVGFESVKGITPGRVELRIAGVKAGSVKDTELKDGRAVMTINLEKKYAPLHTDAKIVIRPVTALEDEYVDILSRGSKDKPELGKDQILSQANTKSQVETGRVLNVLDDDTRARFSQLLTQLGAGTRDRGQKLREGFEELAPFLRAAANLGDALQERKKNTARLISNLGDLTTTLATRNQQISGFVTNGGKILGELAQHSSTLNSTIAQLPGTLQNAQATFANLRATTDPLDKALTSLKPVAKQLPSGLDSLSAFSTEATPPVRSLRPSVTALRPLARELRRTSSNGQAALTPLVGQFKQLNHGTDLLKPCLPAVGMITERYPSLLKYSGNGGAQDPNGSLSADARALATVDLGGTVGNGQEKTGFDKFGIVQPCFSNPEQITTANYGTFTPIPSRSDAVSQEQK